MSSPVPSSPLPEAYVQAYTGYKLIAVAAAFIPILVIFVALRFYARSLNRASLWLDDWLVLWSLILQIGLSGVAIAFVTHAGVGRHQDALEQISPHTVTLYWKYLLVVSFYYFFCVAWPKLAILALYYRLFGNAGHSRVYRYAIFGLAAIIIATCIVGSIFTLNLCHPFPVNWDRTLLNTIPGAFCFDETYFYRYGSVPNIVTDVCMLILPIPIVWGLNVSQRDKWSLTAVFLTGSLGLATSIVRFSTFFVGGSAIEDGTWNSVALMTWTVVEPDVYLITACLPTYRPLYQKLFGVIQNKTGSQYSKSTEGARALYSMDRRHKRVLNTLNGHPSARGTMVGFSKLDNGTTCYSSIESEETAIALAHIAEEEVKRALPSENGIRVDNTIIITTRKADSDDGRSSDS